MTTLKIPANADINFVGEFKEQMIVACQSDQAIVLDVSKVDVLSTPLLQLFLTLHKKAEESHLKLSFKNPSDNFKQALSTFGCLHYLERLMK
jgi:anti-anti-sigma regulatory factor